MTTTGFGDLGAQFLGAGEVKTLALRPGPTWTKGAAPIGSPRNGPCVRPDWNSWRSSWRWRPRLRSRRSPRTARPFATAATNRRGTDLAAWRRTPDRGKQRTRRWVSIFKSRRMDFVFEQNPISIQSLSTTTMEWLRLDLLIMGSLRIFLYFLSLVEYHWKQQSFLPIWLEFKTDKLVNGGFLCIHQVWHYIQTFNTDTVPCCPNHGGSPKWPIWAGSRWPPLYGILLCP